MTALGTAVAALALAADPRAQLEALQARKAAEEAAARELAGREGSILDALQAAEDALRDADQDARRAEEERAEGDLRLARARAEEDAAQARLLARREELAPRMLARTRLGHLGELRLLAASASLADLVKRRYLLDRVLAHDAELLRDGQRALAERERTRAARAAAAGRLAALAAEAQGRRQLALARRSDRRALLDAVRNAKVLHEKAAHEAGEQERRLAEFIAALPPPRSGAPLHAGFAGLRGKLPRPAEGAIEVGFGKVVDPRWSTVTVQKGIDIRAAPGAAVRAVAPGRVAHAGWFKGYGNLVIVDHGDAFHTLVAHLGSLSTAMGEEVASGALLGTVGDTGSLKGAYLYFEIREKGRPVDPRPWLRP